MSLKGVLLVTCVLLTTAALTESDYYTWVDENGVTNYAQKKPTEYDARFITKSYRFGYRATETPVQEEKAPSSETAPSDSQEVDPDALIAEERAKFQAQLAEEKRFNCDVGKKNLTRLETFGRIKITDEDGNQRVMTPAEMDAKKIESRALIRENCKG